MIPPHGAPPTYDVIVIGGGPAGMMAAGAAAGRGARTALVEKNDTFGKKLLITGSGRCNLAPVDGDTRDVVAAFGTPGKFLYPALNALSVDDTIRFFAGIGVSVIREGEKYFPSTGGAKGVRDAIVAWLRASGVTLMRGAVVTGVDPAGGAVTVGDDRITAKRIIIATGGLSYAGTGCTGDGFSWARRLGHGVITPRPALTPVRVAEAFPGQLEGVSLRDVAANLYDGKRKAGSVRDDIVFTRDGMSGPAIYRLSLGAGSVEPSGMRLGIDLFPDTAQDALAVRLQKLSDAGGKRMLKTVLGEMVAARLVPVVLEMSGAAGDTRAAEIPRPVRGRIVQTLKDMPFTVKEFAGFRRATITAGGVSLDEVNPKTMASKVVDNLYFAGEVLDIAGPTGGYNLQVCWSTGWLAGLSAAAGSD